MNTMSVLIIAIGGAMLLEGAMYALFPGPMKRAMAEMQFLPEHVLRMAGLAIAALGLLTIWALIPKG